VTSAVVQVFGRRDAETIRALLFGSFQTSHDVRLVSAIRNKADIRNGPPLGSAENLGSHRYLLGLHTTAVSRAAAEALSQGT
jgi:hypothetical protein